MLTSFWFRTSKGLGYGVTAESEDEARVLLRSLGYPLIDQEIVEVLSNVRFDQLDQRHVAPNCGPIVVRGVWFPNHNLGDAPNNSFKPSPLRGLGAGLYD